MTTIEYVYKFLFVNFSGGGGLDVRRHLRPPRGLRQVWAEEGGRTHDELVPFGMAKWEQGGGGSLRHRFRHRRPRPLRAGGTDWEVDSQGERGDQAHEVATVLIFILLKPPPPAVSRGIGHFNKALYDPAFSLLHNHKSEPLIG